MKPEEEQYNQGYNCNFQLNMGEECSRKRNWITLGGVHRERTSSSKHLVGHTGGKGAPVWPRLFIEVQVFGWAGIDMGEKMLA